MYKKPRRGLRTSIVASAIFAVGAGLGWHFANLLFGRETPPPTVAAVRFEDSRPDAIPAPQRHDASLPAPSLPTQGDDRRSYQPDVTVRSSDEERRLAEALQWAERYRQRQDASVQGVIARQVQDEKVRLAALEAQRWAEVAEQSRRIKQQPVEMRKLIAAQGEQQHGARSVAGSTRVANAGGVVVGGMASAKVRPNVTRARLVPCEHCGRGRKQARAVRKTRVAGYRRRVNRADYALDELLCPLRWLEAAFMGDRHSGRRYDRRHTWLG
jgi:hypothetical protein